MSKEVNRIAIGGFVVGGIGLAILAVLLFGSGKFFQRKIMHVLFFEGSVQGLNVGSPVKFRGVNIGMVKDIQLTINPDDLEFFVPVYVEIFQNRISILGEKELVEFDDEKAVDTLVTEMGLRAQLQMQSLLTGQLFINYDFNPETPIKKIGLEKKVYEVPTIPTALQMLTETLEQIIAEIRRANFTEIMEDMAQTAKGANKLMNSPDLSEAVVSLNIALHDVRKFIVQAEKLATQVEVRVDSMAESFGTVMQDTRNMVRKIDNRIEPLATDIESVLTAVRSSVEKAEVLLAEAREMLAENPKLRREILLTLESVSDAARSLEDLTEYLQLHPEAIVTGKK